MFAKKKAELAAAGILAVIVSVVAVYLYRSSADFSLESIELAFFKRALSPEASSRHLKNLEKLVLTQQLDEQEMLTLDSLALRTQFTTRREDVLLESWLARPWEEARATIDSMVRHDQVGSYLLFFHTLNEELRRAVLATRTNIDSSRWQVAEVLAADFEEVTGNDFLTQQFTFYRHLQGPAVRQKVLFEAYFRELRRRLNWAHPDHLKLLGVTYRLARDLGDRKGQIDLLGRLQYLLLEAYGMTHTAEALGKALIAEARELHYDFGEARVYYYLGHILVDMGHFTEAATWYEHAKKIYRSYNYLGGMADIYGRLGVVHRRTGQLELAEQDYRSMFDLRPDGYTRVRYLIGLGNVKKDMGNFVEAESLFAEARKLAAKLGDVNLIIALTNLGELTLELGNYDRAETYLLRAQALADSSGPPHTRISILDHLTNLYVTQGDFAKAKEMADRAGKLLSEFDFGLLKARNAVVVGKLYARTGELESAIAAFTDGLQIFKTLGVVNEQASTLNLIGETARLGNDYARAEPYLKQALTLSRRFRLSTQTWASYFYLARLYRDRGQLEEARQLYQNAVKIVKRLTSTVRNAADRSSFSQKIQPLFEEMVTLQLQLGDTLEAFRYSEEERAQVLSMLLAKQPGPGTTNGSGQFVRTSIARPASHRLALLERLQALLEPDVAVVEYEVTEEQLVIWTVTRTSFHAHVVDISRTDLEAEIKAFRRQQDAANLDMARFETSFAATRQLGGRLFELLVKPVMPYLEDMELVYFVPDEAFYFLPFAALVTDDGRYLIERVSLATMPSARILLEYLRQPPRAPTLKRVLAVGSNSQDLKFAEAEAKRVAQVVQDAVLLIGDAVSESALRDYLRRPFRAVLFASHSKINERFPDYSGLVLSPSAGREPAAPEKDGFLSAKELQEQPLHNLELIFLSACETASGRLYRGEGLIGLQRACMAAGAQAVIANLWKVDDWAAKQLTVDFFDFWLNQNYGKAKALQKAQLKLIDWLRSAPLFEGKAHPFFWGAAVLSGSYY